MNMEILDNLREAFRCRYKELIASVGTFCSFPYNDSSYDVFQKLLSLGDVKEGDRVLDVGCGLWYPAYYRRDNSYEVMGLDKHEEALRRAKEKDSTLSLLVGDAKNLPVGGNFFDAVVSKDVEMYPGYVQAVEEMARVVKPRGKVVIMRTSALRGLEIAKLTLENLGFSDVEISTRLIRQKMREIKYKREEIRRRREKSTLGDIIKDFLVKLEFFDEEERRELEEIRNQALPAYVYGTKPI